MVIILIVKLIYDDYLIKSEEKRITAIRHNTNNTKINRIRITKKEKWEENQLYL